VPIASTRHTFALGSETDIARPLTQDFANVFSAACPISQISIAANDNFLQ
jgi:hypothetical protein